MKKPMEPWAAFIVAEAFKDLARGMSKKVVIEKVQSTALYARKDYWREFLRLIRLREKAGIKVNP